MTTTFRVYDVSSSYVHCYRHQYEYDGNDIGYYIEKNKIKNQANTLRMIRSKSEFVKRIIFFIR